MLAGYTGDGVFLMFNVVYSIDRYVIARCSTIDDAEDQLHYNEDMMKDAGLYQDGMFDIEEVEDE